MLWVNSNISSSQKLTSYRFIQLLSNKVFILFKLKRLLGVNGAGKTTTLSILIGQMKSSNGHAFINGYNIEKDRFQAIKSLGFCPQFDYLPEFLTVEQSLRLFAKLRGLRGSDIDVIIKDFMDAFKLNEFHNKLVQNLR